MAPYALTLDANDNVYIGSQNALGTAGLTSFASSIAANGTTNFSSASSTILTAPRGAATDTLGHIWFTQNNTTQVQGLNLTTGPAFATLTTGALPFGLGVDRSNNVWYGISSTTTQNLFEFVQAAGYTSATFLPNAPQFSSAVRTIAFDAAQNVHDSGFSTTTNTAGSYQNTGTATVPVYSAFAPVNAVLTGANGAGIALDSSSNAWAPTTTGLFRVTPAFSSGVPPTFTPTGPLTDNVTAPNYIATDGSGNNWITNNITGVPPISQFIPEISTAFSLSPCSPSPAHRHSPPALASRSAPRWIAPVQCGLPRSATAACINCSAQEAQRGHSCHWVRPVFNRSRFIAFYS